MINNINSLFTLARASFAWSIILKFVQQFYSLLVTIFAARLLGPQVFGDMAIAMALVVYLNSLTSFGMNNSIIYAENIEKIQVDVLFTFNILLSAALAFAVIVLSNEISTFFNSKALGEILPVLSLILPLSTFYNLPMALLRKQLNFKLHSIVDFVQYIFSSSLLFVMVVNDFGIWSLVISQLSGYTLSVLVLFIFYNWRPCFNFNFFELDKLVDYALWDFIRYNVNFFDSYISYFVSGKFIGTFMVGLYDRAISFLTIFERIFQIQINAIFFSAYSRLKNDKSKLIAVFEAGLFFQLLICTPIFVGIYLVVHHVVNIFLGEEWSLTVQIAQVLCFGAFFKMLSNYAKNFNISTLSYKVQSIYDIICLSINFCICLIFVQYGIFYVAVVSSVMYFFSSIVNFIIIMQVYKLNMFKIFKMLILVFFLCAIILVCNQIVNYLFYNFSNLSILILKILFSFFSYIFIVLIFYNFICYDFINSMILQVKKI